MAFAHFLQGNPISLDWIGSLEHAATRIARHWSWAEYLVGFLVTHLPAFRPTLNVLDKLWIEIGEPVELRLVKVHHEELVGRRQVRLLRGELTVKVGHVLAMFLKGEFGLEQIWPLEVAWNLTIFGLNGGCTSRFSIFSQSMRRKKAWARTSSSPRAPQPKRFCGFLVNS